MRHPCCRCPHRAPKRSPKKLLKAKVDPVPKIEKPRRKRRDFSLYHISLVCKCSNASTRHFLHGICHPFENLVYLADGLPDSIRFTKIVDCCHIGLHTIMTLFDQISKREGFSCNTFARLLSIAIQPDRHIQALQMPGYPRIIDSPKNIRNIKDPIVKPLRSHHYPTVTGYLIDIAAIAIQVRFVKC